jgi:hypothetical protein
MMRRAEAAWSAEPTAAHANFDGAEARTACPVIDSVEPIRSEPRNRGGG